MQSVSLNELSGIHLEKARSSSAGRSATTVYGDHSHGLRQTLIALAAGEPGNEIQSPMAGVILGGLASSTALVLVVLPVLYERYGAPPQASESEA